MQSSVYVSRCPSKKKTRQRGHLTKISVSCTIPCRRKCWRTHHHRAGGVDDVAPGRWLGIAAVDGGQDQLLLQVRAAQDVLHVLKHVSQCKLVAMCAYTCKYTNISLIIFCSYTWCAYLLNNIYSKPNLMHFKYWINKIKQKNNIKLKWRQYKFLNIKSALSFFMLNSILSAHLTSLSKIKYFL